MSTPANEVLDLIESWRDEMVDFACRLVATPSPTPTGDERAVAQVIVAQLRSLGLTDITIAAARPERPNVLCRISGSGDARADEGTRPALLLSAHVDTKPIGDAASRWEIDPHNPTIRDGKLYGLGATDMKAAVAAIVYASAAIARASRGSPNALRGDLILALSADEEGGSAFGARYLTRDMIINGHTCVPLFVQEAGIAALRGPQDCVAAMRAEYHARRDLVVEGLNAIPGITCTTPVSRPCPAPTSAATGKATSVSRTRPRKTSWRKDCAAFGPPLNICIRTGDGPHHWNSSSA